MFDRKLPKSMDRNEYMVQTFNLAELLTVDTISDRKSRGSLLNSVAKAGGTNDAVGR